jgi:TolB protein
MVVAAIWWGRSNANPGRALAGPDMGGNIAFIRGGAIWFYTAGESRPLTVGPKDKLDKRDAYPSFSPDGQEIVYTRIDEGFSDLYKLKVSRPANPIALTDHRPNVEVGQVEIAGVQEGYNRLALWANYPAWSPNGSEIAFMSDVGTEYPNLRVIFPDHEPDMGSSPLASAPGRDWSQQTVEHPSWSPNGDKIVVATYLTDGSIGQVWIYNITTGHWTAVTDSKEGAYDPAWSPDGEWIAFTMREGGRTDIYVVNADAQTWTEEYPTPVKLTTDGASRSPAWSPDGSKLAYLTLANTSFDLHAAAFRIDADGTPGLDSPQKLTDNANIDATSGLSWGR